MENNPKLGPAADGEEQEAAAKNSRIEQHGGNPASFWSNNNNNNNNGGLLPERPRESAGTIGSGGGDSDNNEINNDNDQTPPAAAAADAAAAAVQHRQSGGTGNTRRTPFTNLSQVDADLALARTLQEQERAYMMLMMNNEGSDYGSWDAGSYYDDDDDDAEDEDDFGDPGDGTDGDDEADNAGVEEDGKSDVDDHDDGVDAFDVHACEHVGENDDEDNDDEDDNDENAEVELDPAAFSSDEAYARALQDAEEREMAARLLALVGITDGQRQDGEDYSANSQDTWEEVDPDELSYEELLALGEVVGTESRGLSADTIASLPSVNYKSGGNQSGSNDSCVICRLDYEDGETLTLLSCKHSYHLECINNWLKINKVCPVCSAEVTTSGHS